MQTVSMIFKILGLSALVTVLIKYVAPLLTIPATNQVALIVVLSPSIVIAGWLTVAGLVGAKASDGPNEPA